MYKELLAYPNVVGAGLGYKKTRGEYTGQSALVVLVEKKLPSFSLTKQELIPKEYKRFTTDVIEVGKIVALSPTDKHRPAPPGVSIGHYRITAGTFGAVVQEGGAKYILSNNHVLANSNDAEIGDPILQPGPYDGGTMDDQIGTLYKFVPIIFGEGLPTCPFASGLSSVANWIASKLGSSHRLNAVKISQESNKVDCALARPLNYDMITEEIYGLGAVTGVASAKLGMPVIKSGRTSGITEGMVTILNATVSVDYGGKTATFEDQIITDYMSEGGDSGSLLLEADTMKAVGLLYAGSDQVTIYNTIQNVLETLDITF